ncbi:hypothetical protein F442_07859 [Phytophthora nicotianae P10297]|uniref:Uncharacterized protein n=1 Tax=Phytophthora nicotianae P10297 TaxID=1317064 RepID=W2ZET3_PHYNI|nr:hypothetical protein F442_07859 [Phytophthora nicotianae P10297]
MVAAGAGIEANTSPMWHRAVLTLAVEQLRHDFIVIMELQQDIKAVILFAIWFSMLTRIVTLRFELRAVSLVLWFSCLAVSRGLDCGKGGPKPTPDQPFLHQQCPVEPVIELNRFAGPPESCASVTDLRLADMLVVVLGHSESRSQDSGASVRVDIRVAGALVRDTFAVDHDETTLSVVSLSH